MASLPRVGSILAPTPTAPVVPGREVATHRLTERIARLEPGTTLAFADLHNHTHLSDGAGRAADAYQRMRDAGLDVAALTDHVRCGPDPDPCGGGWTGIDDAAWEIAALLADRANDDGAFVAIRGFEWSSPLFGHVNVWGSARWTDEPSIAAFHRWLAASPARSPRAPGGLASFNHPGRDGSTFDGFAHASVADGRIVALEIFNRDEDYLFEGVDEGGDSPLVACLDAGWRVGLSGVTDEHEDRWGLQESQGRTGVWVWERTRAGIREALRSRRFYATRVSGLRVDAMANGARMGASAGRRDDRTRVHLDLDRGSSWVGKPLLVQALGPGRPLPDLLEIVEIEVPGRGRAIDLDLPPIDRWMVLRISDPALPPDPRAPVPWRGLGGAIAYTSPFFAPPT
jgi:hypothetical protein